jgi:hypothetical protein
MRAKPPDETMLNPSLHSRIGDLAAHFQRRDPFRHVVIDDFFAPDYCAALLAEFPPFETGNARNEAGELGNKSTTTLELATNALAPRMQRIAMSASGAARP